MSEFQIVRYKKGKSAYELLVKPNTFLKFKEGTLTLKETLFSDTIFLSYSKGDRAKLEEIAKEFPGKTPNEILNEMISNGDYQMSTLERKSMQDEKKRQIINYIHKYYLDPRTKKPHPFARIEDAFPLTKYNVDLFEPIEKQAQLVAKKLIDLQLPLSKTEMLATVRVEHAQLNVAMATIKKYCSIKKDSYDNSGCTMDVTIIPGDYEIFLKEMNSVTKGAFEFDIVGAPKVTVEDIVDKKGGKKGQKKK